VLCSLLWVTLLGQGVGLGDPQRALPTPAMLGLCDSVSVTLETRGILLLILELFFYFLYFFL